MAALISSNSFCDADQMASTYFGDGFLEARRGCRDVKGLIDGGPGSAAVDSEKAGTRSSEFEVA